MWTLKYIAPLGAVALLSGWLLGKDAIGMAVMGMQPEVAAPAPDYGDTAMWLHYPGEPPASVWEGGWDVDLFLLPPWPKAWQPGGVIDPAGTGYRTLQADALDAILPALEATGPVYCPALRLPSPTTPDDWSKAEADLERALDHYFDHANGGRALAVYGLPGSGLPGSGLDGGGLEAAVAKAVAARSDLEQARIVVLGASLSDAGVESAAPFGHRLGAQPPGGVYPYRPRSPAGLETVTATLAGLRADWLAHLEQNVPKPAEPLGDFETISVAPVHTADGERIDE